MKIRLKILLFFISFTSSICSEPELPFCPTDVQFLPQNLPMHCRLRRDAKYPGFPGAQMFPMPPPPGMPGMVGPGPMSMPMPMPMPMQPPGPSAKVPVIVMPFYSPDPAYKKPPYRGRRPAEYYPRPPPRRPPYHSDTSSDTDISSDISSDMSSEGRGWWKGNRNFRRTARRLNRRHRPKRRRHNRRALLTPVLQYVTKDGYVIYEKRISNGEAKDWLNVKKEMAEEENQVPEARNTDVIVQETSDENDDVELMPDKKEKSKEEAEEIKLQRVQVRKYPHRVQFNKSHRQKEIKKHELASSQT